MLKSTPYILHYVSHVDFFYVKTGLVSRRRLNLDHDVSFVRHGALFVSSSFTVPRRASAVAVASGGRATQSRGGGGAPCGCTGYSAAGRSGRLPSTYAGTRRRAGNAEAGKEP